MSKAEQKSGDKVRVEDAQAKLWETMGEHKRAPLPTPVADGNVPPLTPEQQRYLNEQATAAAAKIHAVYVNNVMFASTSDGKMCRVTFAENLLSPYVPEPRVSIVMDWGAMKHFGEGFMKFFAD